MAKTPAQALTLSLAFMTSTLARQMPFTDDLVRNDDANLTVLVDMDADGEISNYMEQKTKVSDPLFTEDSNLPLITVPLRRNLVPIRRQGKIVTHKTSYSGEISLGAPAQLFRVCFDTGSGHVIVPAAGCQSESCRTHNTYNLADSKTGTAIQASGRALKPNELAEEVTIGFGTGVIKSQFVNDHVCLGSMGNDAAGNETASNETHRRKGCLEMRVLAAVEMSTNPFVAYLFDGIVGLGLSMLAVSEEFSFFHLLSHSGQLAAGQFGFFLTDGEHGEESEISFGGVDPRHILGPTSWTPVIMADEGHWLVAIKAVRVNGEVLDICRDGSCRGVVDTGTSHIGVPVKEKQTLNDVLTRDAEDYLDCRLAESYTLEFELDGVNLTLLPENYMRRMPLREGVVVGGAIVSDDLVAAAGNLTRNSSEVDITATNVTRLCNPRLMGTNMPEPLGPNLWILGEPVVQKYYTVYDWAKLRVGFALANSRRNKMPKASGKGSLPEDVAAEGHLLSQKFQRENSQTSSVEDSYMF